MQSNIVNGLDEDEMVVVFSRQAKFEVRQPKSSR